MELITYLHTTHSTNLLAIEAGNRGAVHGTAFVAQDQTGGRGRLGRNWFSSLDKGLYCSILVRPRIDLKHYPKLTFIAGLAVAQALEKKISIPVQLKWPNDIYFKNKKCGGILTESSILKNEQSDTFAVIGLGLNVNLTHVEFPEDIQNRVTSLYIETGREWDIQSVFQDIYKEILLNIQNFEKNGFHEFIEKWREKDCTKDKTLQWLSVTGKTVIGKSLGVDEDGKLYIRDVTGDIHEILSGDVQLAENAGDLND